MGSGGRSTGVDEGRGEVAAAAASAAVAEAGVVPCGNLCERCPLVAFAGHPQDLVQSGSWQAGIEESLEVFRSFGLQSGEECYARSARCKAAGASGAWVERRDGQITQ